MQTYRYLNTDIYVEEQGETKISLLQSSSMYPLSKFYSEEGIAKAVTNCSYFTTSYVLGRNQGDTYNEAPDQDFYSVVVRNDNSYRCDILASWEERDGIVAGFSVPVVLIKNGTDVELTSSAITDSKSRLSTRNPNTAFGFLKNGKAILVVNTGRLSNSTGLTGRELRTFLKTKYDLDLLVLLDGGGSTEMILDGKIVNALSDGSERKMWNGLAFVDSKATQYATLPVRHTGVTQGMNGSTSHVGTKAIDFGYNTGYEKQPLYAPFDCKVMWADEIKKGGTVALQSLKPVKLADGTEDFMTVISEHSNDRPEAGKTFKQGEIYAHMGNAGTDSYHTHIEVEKGKYKKYTGTRYQSGIKAYVYIFPNTVAPYEALYLSPDTIMNPGVIQYPWKRIPTVIDPVQRVTEKDQIKVLVDNLRVRTDHSTTAEFVGYAQKDGYYFDLEQFADGTYTWHKIADNQWLADDGEWLEILPGVNEVVEQYKKEIKTLKSQLTKAQNKIKYLEEKLAAKTAEIETLNTDISKIQNAYNSLLEEHDQIKGAYEVLSEKYTQIVLRIQTFVEDISKWTK